MGDETVQLHDLALMHKELTLTERISVEDISMLIWGDVHSDYEKLAVLYVDIGILQIDLTRSEAFDLGTEKLDARFVLFVHEIVVIGFFILRDDLCAAAFVISHSRHLTFLNFARNTGAEIIILYFFAVVKGNCVERRLNCLVFDQKLHDWVVFKLHDLDVGGNC